MAYPRPIPDGWTLDKQWKDSKPAAPPTLPSTWTATLLLSPFGDSISPLRNSSQIAIGTIEYSYTDDFSGMRVRLYNTQDLVYFDFLFVKSADSAAWYWLDSTPNGPVKNIYGPFRTTLQVPAPDFLSAAQWGNTYPLMNKDCDHFVVATPGATDHGNWYAFRRDTGNLFRVFMMDSDNPLMMPILGAYYIANLPTFTPDSISDDTTTVMRQVQSGHAVARADYWNPLVTQEDIHRAMAFPLGSASCTPGDLKAVIPGFTPVPAGVTPPVWSNQTYIEGWTLGTDFIPYWTRVCYLWTSDANSKQQTVFVGLGLNAGQGTYYLRSDRCLNTNGTTQPYYTFPVGGFGDWTWTLCQQPIPGVGLPKPDWLKLDDGRAMAQIVGNSDFGLVQGQALNLFAAPLPRGAGELAIFWVWFTGEGNGVLFTEGNYLHPRSHNLQLIDYTLFVQSAGITQEAFDSPCGWLPAAERAQALSVHGHPTTAGSLPGA
jgi:hypothetical protein